MNALERDVARVVDVPIDELRQPAIADAGRCGDGLPFASAAVQKGADLKIKGLFHAGILVMCYLPVKYLVTESRWHHAGMQGKFSRGANETLAANLQAAMQAAGLSQTALAKKSGVSQKTISNYLNPQQRVGGVSGKAPSAKLTEVEAIARALGVEAWELLRPMSQAERQLYTKIEAHFREMVALLNPDDPLGKGMPAPVEPLSIVFRTGTV